MSKFNENLISIHHRIRPNKILIYNRKEYPVDYNLIKQYSNYFYENEKIYESTKVIELPEEEIEISDDDFKNFVLCCQNQKFALTDSNVFQLYHLSISYDVPDLNDITNEYISKSKNLIFKSIKYKTQLSLKKAEDDQKQFNCISEESEIASNFFDYINDDQIFTLPIHSLYRIINIHNSNNNEINQTNQTKFIEFLFKCLDKYKRDASILFSNINFDQQPIEIYNRLINEYSDIFDFNVINSKFIMKTTTELLNELTKLKIEYTKSISDMNALILKQNQLFENQMDKFNKLELIQNEQFKKHEQLLNQTDNYKSSLEIKYEETISKHKNDMNEMKERLDSLERKLQEQQNKYSSLEEIHQKTISNMKNEYEGKISLKTQEINQLESEKQKLISENKASVAEKEQIEKSFKQKEIEYLAKIKETEKKQKEEERSIKTLSYKEGKEFKGIIKYLTEKTGSNIHDNHTIEVTSNSFQSSHHPKNLLDFNQDSNYISDGAVLNAWICFDFKNIKIEISNYSIKSFNFDTGKTHIKSWVIEISDDGNNWTKIDEHSNYDGLNGSLITKTFSVSPNHFTRYCRLRCIGDYFGYPDWCFALNSMEFYGRLKEP